MKFLLESLKQFYTKKLYSLLKKESSRPLFSIFKFCCKQILLFISALSHQKGILSSNNSWPSNGSDIIKVCKISALVLNCVIFIYLFIHFTVFYYYLDKYKGKEHKKKLMQQKPKSANFLEIIFNPLCKLLIQSYESLLVVPLIHFSFNYDFEIALGAVNCIYTAAIGIIICDCDYDYSSERQKVCLGRPYHSTQNLSFLTLIGCMFGQSLWKNESFLILMLYYFIEFLLYLIFRRYFCSKMDCFVIFTLLYGFAISTSCQLYSPLSEGNRYTSVVILFMIPLIGSVSIKISNELERKQIENFLQNEDHISWRDVDFIMRNNLLVVESKKKAEKMQIIFLALSLSIQEEESFVIEYEEIGRQIRKRNMVSSSDQSIFFKSDELLINKLQKKLLQCYQEKMRNFSSKRGNRGMQEIEWYFSYFIFLIQKKKNFILYMMEAQSMKNERNLQLKQQQILYSIEEFFRKEKETLDRIQNYESPFSNTFINSIIFEEELKQIESEFEQAVVLKLELMKMMDERNINSLELMNKLENLESKNHDVKKSIFKMAQINRNHLDLVHLQDTFTELLSFSRKDFEQKSKNFKKQEGLFSKNNDDSTGCIIFAVLDKEKSWIIKKVSSSFFKIFQLQPKDVKNQDITILMMQGFRQNHYQYIDDFLASDCSNISVEKHKNRVLYARNGRGFIISVKLDVRVNEYQDKQQTYLGLSAELSLTEEEIMVIVYNQINLQIISYSEPLSFIIQKMFKESKINEAFPFILSYNSEVDENKNKDKGQLQKMDSSTTSKKYCFEKDKNPFNVNIEYLMVNIKKKKVGIDSQLDEKEDLLSSKNKYSFKLINLEINPSQHRYNKEIGVLKVYSIQNLNFQDDSHLIRVFISENIGYYNAAIGKAETSSLLKELNFQEQQSHTKDELLENETNNNQNQSFSSASEASWMILNPNKQEQSKIRDNTTLSQSNQQIYPSISNNTNNVISSINNYVNIDTKQQSKLETYQAKPTSIYLSEENKQLISFQNSTLIYPSNEQNKQYNEYSREGGISKDCENFMSNQNKSLEAIDQLLIGPSTPKIQTPMLVSPTQNTENEEERLSCLNSVRSQNNINSARGSNRNNSARTFFKDKNSNSANSKIFAAANEIFQFSLKKKARHSLEDILEDKNQAQNSNQQKFFPSAFFKKKNQEKELERVSTFLKNKSHTLALSANNHNNHKHSQIINQIQDNVSHSSQESTQTSAKKLLYQLVKSKNRSKAIQIINIFGFLSFIIIFGLALIQFLITTNKIDSNLIEWNEFDFPSVYQENLFTMMKDMNILSLLNRTDNVYYFSIIPSLKTEIVNESSWHSWVIKSENAQMISHMSHVGKNRRVFQMMLDKPANYTIGQNYNMTILNQTSSVPTVLLGILYPTCLFYAITFSQYHTFRYAAQLASGRPEYFTIVNQLRLSGYLSEIYADIQEEKIQEKDTITYQLTLTMSMVIAISGLCVGIIGPLFSYVQSLRDEMLALFGTFTSLQIEQTSFKLNRYLQSQSKQMGLSSKLSQTSVLKPTSRGYRENKIMNYQKKQQRHTISQISKLPKINIYLFLGIIGIFCLVVASPIINQIITSNYFDQVVLDYKTTYMVHQARAHLLELIGLNYFCLTMKLYPASKPMKLYQFIDNASQLHLQTPNISQVLNNLVLSQNKDSRYQQQKYDDFFFPMLNENIYDNLVAFPQYSSNQTSPIAMSQCKSIKNNYLSQGFQLGFNQYITYFDKIYSFLAENDTVKNQQILTQLKAQFNIYEVSIFAKCLSESAYTMEQFIKEIHLDYYNLITIEQLALLIIQLLFLIFIFLIGWIKLSNQLSLKMHQTQGYLQVLNINMLLDNTYVISYVRNHKIK